METRTCRFCNKTTNQIFIELGMLPLSNSFLNSEMIHQTESVYPLRVFFCKNCFLVQIEEFETPEKIFTNYAYFSSYSETWLNHAKNYVDMMIEKFGIERKNLVIEIASNDGYLLQYFKKKNIPILGIEPAVNVAKSATIKGIPTITKFFNEALARELIQQGKQADLIIGNNVIAHIPNLNDFVKGLKILLSTRGIITIEFPHLLQLMKNNQFDTIYHEHFSYYSFFVIQKIFSYHNLIIFDVEKLTTHGGSLRIFVRHPENSNLKISDNVNKILEEEKKYKLNEIATYENFSDKAKLIKKNLSEFLISVKNDNKKIVCYGAAAKGNTLLNYCGIDTDLIEYVVDRNPHKQGLFLPGSHIPIKDPDKIRETKPDYILITVWNLQDEIMKQISFIREWGGKFIIPIPEVKILP